MTQTPDTIDWTHVAPQYKWMARDDDGDVNLFENKPVFDAPLGYWSQSEFDDFWAFASANAFASYRRGTCEWQDSLAQRPERT